MQVTLEDKRRHPGGQEKAPWRARKGTLEGETSWTTYNNGHIKTYRLAEGMKEGRKGRRKEGRDEGMKEGMKGRRKEGRKEGRDEGRKEGSKKGLNV